MPDGNAVLPLDRLSDLRRWAEKNVIVGDGPRAGQPYRIGGAPWGEVLDSMDDPEIEQVTIRGSVQSGKTALLIVAGLGHMAAGRSVLIFEPDDRLKRTLAARILAWGRLCADVTVREAYEPKRPPFWRVGASGGRLEVVSAREGGAGLMRTAEIVIVDELRVFHRDMLGELVDRMAELRRRRPAYHGIVGGLRGRVPNDGRARQERCPAMVSRLPVVRPGEHRRMAKRGLQESPRADLCHAVLWRRA